MEGHNPELKPFLLPNVRATGVEIGVGSYGSVVEVAIPGAICAAKQIHDYLQVKNPPNVAMRKAMELDKESAKFVKECKLMSTLRHPNIVQFLGLHFFPGARLPALVMERLLTSLHELLDPETDAPKSPFFPLGLKCSILQDVANGLAFLHERSPPIIHRDLSAKNVLLNSGMVAKIADLGMARLVTHTKRAAIMTKAPGASVYMPPEALENKPGDEKEDKKDQEKHSKYDASIDIFSFGVVAIFALSHTFPCDLLAPNYREDGRHIARTELERREKYMKIIREQLPENHPLLGVIEGCLGFPEDRPTICEVLDLLEQSMPAGNASLGIGMSKLELLQVLQSKKVNEQTREKESYELQMSMAQLKAEKSKKVLEEEKSKMTIKFLSDHVKVLTKENSDLKNSVRKLGFLQTEGGQLGTKVNELQERVKILTEEKEQLQSTLEFTQAQALTYEEDLKTVRDDCARAFAERDEVGKPYRAEIERLQQQLKIHKGNVSGLEQVHLARQAELVQTVDELKECQQDVQTKTSQVKQYKKQHDGLVTKVETLEKEKKQLTEMLQHEQKSKTAPQQAESVRVRAKLEKKYREKSKQRKAQLANLSVDYHNVKQELHRVRKEADKLRKDRRKSAGSEVSINSPISDSEFTTSLNEPSDRNHSLDLENQELRSEIETLQATIHRLNELLATPSDDDSDGGVTIQKFHHQEPGGRPHLGLTSLPSPLLHRQEPAVGRPHLPAGHPQKPPAAAPRKKELLMRAEQHRLGDDVLTPGINAEVHNVAQGVLDDMVEGGEGAEVTGIPYDPNLTCIVCQKVFRIGEIQLYRNHTANCGSKDFS